MAEHIRAYPWETSPIGPIDSWSPTLLAIVNMMLSSPIPSAVYWGPELIFLCNDASIRILTSKPSKILGVTAESIWAEHWEEVKPRFQSVLTTGASFQREDVPFAFRRDGRLDEIFLNYSLSPIYQDGKVAGIFRTLEETTDTTLAMRALAESDARLRMALTVGNAAGVWEWHIQKNLVYSDKVVSSFYGIDPKDAAAGTSNLPYERMLHPDDIVLLADAVLGCITTGKDFSVDYRVRQADDSYRWIQSKGRCIFDENGHARSISGLKIDITEQKTAELAKALPRNLFPPDGSNTLPPSVTTFVAATANLLAEFPSQVEVHAFPESLGTQIVLRVAKNDLGNVIGKQGRIIRSVRILLQTFAATCKHRVTIDVESKDGVTKKIPVEPA